MISYLLISFFNVSSKSSSSLISSSLSSHVAKGYFSKGYDSKQSPEHSAFSDVDEPEPILVKVEGGKTGGANSNGENPGGKPGGVLGVGGLGGEISPDWKLRCWVVVIPVPG